MKGKNSAFYNALRHFFGKDYFSVREHVVICFLSLIIELCNRIVFLSSLGSNGEWTGWQDTPLFLSLCAFWQVIAVCVWVLFPVMLILCIILWRLLVKNIRKLKEINQQRGKITDQKDWYKESVNSKMDDILVMIFVLVLMCVTVWVAAIPVGILQLYYGVFKQVRTYRCLKKN
ncbi:hypothetical protein [Bartonella grahamii]|uniref:Uncharacterized protein n=2 Tax=Bartonella grahamii TaxID=33045 RepID=A0A336NB83_BARGR|nr:hypothetical protein [Bartonella grahamii]ACS51869.1 hypothetical membrane protein [Bartonella grahamii as4aup]SSZ39434.1 Uncharacterised protein [Bartonella grahamii]